MLFADIAQKGSKSVNKTTTCFPFCFFYFRGGGVPMWWVGVSVELRSLSVRSTVGLAFNGMVGEPMAVVFEHSLIPLSAGGEASGLLDP